MSQDQQKAGRAHERRLPRGDIHPAAVADGEHDLVVAGPLRRTDTQFTCHRPPAAVRGCILGHRVVVRPRDCGWGQHLLAAEADPNDCIGETRRRRRYEKRKSVAWGD